MSYDMFVDVLDDLRHRCPSAEEDAEEIVDNQQNLVGEDELESAALSYFVIKRCIESDNLHIEHTIGRRYGVGTSKHDEALEYFKDIFLETLYDYLDEHIDDQRAILALLRRYKHKCEWFQHEHLLNLWESCTQKGEKLLSRHLFEYLHDQGLNFVIEPLSVSGRADLVGAQETEDPIVADMKIFNPDKGKGKSYIASGFNQIYTYMRNYNEPFGYLIIYKTCERDLRFTLAHQTQSTPFVIHNNKTIFLITIDIAPYEASASKRGVLDVVEITEEDLVQRVERSEH
ncbi:hypothetical protein ACFL6S_00780 [Candidatus Poribacteria bacterium]